MKGSKWMCPPRSGAGVQSLCGLCVVLLMLNGACMLQGTLHNSIRQKALSKQAVCVKAVSLCHVLMLTCVCGTVGALSFSHHQVRKCVQWARQFVCVLCCAVKHHVLCVFAQVLFLLWE